MTNPSVLLIGDVMLDVVVQPTAPLASTSDTPANVKLSRGGSAANIAVAMAMANCQVRYLGAVGDDTAGRLFINEMERVNAQTHLQVVDRPTGVVVALVGADGQRSMLTDRGANPLLSDSFVAAQMGVDFDHLHISGYTLLDQLTRPLAQMALARARDRGRSVSIDVCSVGPLLSVGVSTFLGAASGATHLFANEEEALALSGAADAEEALAFLVNHFSEVVITRGGAGAISRCGDEVVTSSSQSHDVVDTTGAGDAATGGYLAARLKGSSMATALDVAMETAAGVVRGLGARG